MYKSVLALCLALCGPLANAADRLVCAGGNIYWGAGVFELTHLPDQCEFKKFDGYQGVARDGQLTEPSTADYAALITCESYEAAVRVDAKGAYVVVQYPGVGHGSIPRSSEKIRCKYNPDLPSDLRGLSFEDVVNAVRK